MHGPALAGWLLVALCAATGAYCLLRMRSPVIEQRSAAGGEALMGFGMAVMAIPAAVFGPPRWAWLGFGLVFGAAAVRALWAARTDAHHLHHLVGSLAMVYMAVAMAAAPSGGPGHAAHTGPSGVPLISGVLLLYFAGYVLRAGIRLVPVPLPAPASAGVGGAYRAGGAVSWGDRVELALACRLSMGLAMFAMLLTM